MVFENSDQQSLYGFIDISNNSAICGACDVCRFLKLAAIFIEWHQNGTVERSEVSSSRVLERVEVGNRIERYQEIANEGDPIDGSAFTA